MYSLLNELKRRNVFRATTSYAVVAWVVIQGASAIFPAFDAPPWVFKSIVVFICLGLPLVIVLAWAYELTPQGIKRTSEREPASYVNTRFFDYMLTVAILIALVVTVADFRSMTPVLAGRFAEGPTQIDRPRIALTPFVAINTDSETNELALGFADATAESLRATNTLIIAGLDSSFALTSQERSRSEVGEILDVDYLLEGTLSSTNGDVRLFAQLVTLPHGDRVWSYEKEGPREKLREFRDEIATGVQTHFGALPRKTQEQAQGVSDDQFPIWLRVIGALRQGSAASLAAARVLAKQLISQQPDFVDAKAALAYAIAANIQNNPGNTAYFDRAEEANSQLDAAIAEGSKSARVLLWRAETESLVRLWRGLNADFKTIDQFFDRALEVTPNSPDILTAYATHKLRWGDATGAAELGARALEGNSLSEPAWRVRIMALIRSGQRELAASEIARLQSLGIESTELLAQLSQSRGELLDAAKSYSSANLADARIQLEAAKLWASLGETERASHLIEQSTASPRADIWKLAFADDYDEAYAIASAKLETADPADALLLGLLAVQTGHSPEAVGCFSALFSDWLRDTGPLRGITALRYAPWFARALEESDRKVEARRLLDRHLAGVMLAEEQLAPQEVSLYYATNYAVQGRIADAKRSLERAISTGLTLTRGSIGGPIDPLKSTLLASLNVSMIAPSNTIGDRLARYITPAT